MTEGPLRRTLTRTLTIQSVNDEGGGQDDDVRSTARARSRAARGESPTSNASGSRSRRGTSRARDSTASVSVRGGRRHTSIKVPAANVVVAPAPTSLKGRGRPRSPLSSSHLLLETELMHLPLFSNCNSSLVTELANRMEQGTYGRKQVVVEEGAVGSSLLLVRRGSLLMSIDGENVTSIGAKKHFGETNLLAVDTHWKATLTAEVSTEVCLLSRSDLLQALEAYPIETRTFENIRANHDTMACMWGGTIENRCELFDGLSEKTLWAIDAKMVRRLIFQGDKVLSEGEAGDELYLLVQGRVDIVIAGRVVRQASAGDDGGMQTMPLKGEKRNQRPHSVCMFGELGLLGMQEKRSFSVVARTTCQVRVLYRSMLLRILEQRQETLHRMPQFLRKHYNEKQKSVATMEMLRQVPPFCDTECGEDFLQFLLEHLEDAVFLPGQTILDAEASAHEHSRCYFLGEGAAKVLEVSGFNQLEKHVGPGAVIGDLILVATVQDTRRTVIATDMCYLQALHQSVLVRGLELFPQERRKVLLMAYKRDQATDRKPQTPIVSLSLVQDADADWKATELKVVMRAVKGSPFFASISSGFIERLGSVSADRIYMPGDLIIAEGTEGDSMFIMISGMAAVFTSNSKVQTSATTASQRGSLVGQRRSRVSYMKDNKIVELNCQRIGVLKAGSISGEMAMLGIAHARSATIEAETICCMWEITHNAAMPIIEQYPDTRRHFASIIVQNLQHTVPTRIDTMMAFKSFERKFRMLLGLYCERAVFFPKQKIFIEGQQSQGLYIINQGKAQIALGGLPLKTLSSGSHLNATTMLGLRKVCYCSLTALRTCHVIIIPRSSYLQALERYPDKEVNRQITRSEELAEANFRAAMHRTLTRTRVWRWIIAENGHFGGVRLGPTAKNSEKDSAGLQRCFEAWSKFSGASRKRRVEQEERMRVVDQWVEKQQKALAHRQQKDAERSEPFMASSDWSRRKKGKQAARPQSSSSTEPRSRSASPSRETMVQSIYSNWRTGLGLSGAIPASIAKERTFESSPLLPALSSTLDETRLQQLRADNATHVQSARLPQEPSTQRRRRQPPPPWQDIGPLHGKDFGLPIVSPRDQTRRTTSQPSPRNRAWLSRPNPIPSRSEDVTA
mmetsp:Transcript_28221/g.62412  ORF Transcript_28221/g.62412 Transcript_28221/m.62412 type:complete len:1133 (-) Transcript_28221:71-3469(-)